jgi:putative ABC transport system permease protein
MFKTYLLVAYRNFIRNKIFSLINVLGLSIGISASLVIFLIVHYDFSFDKFENNRDRIYRVVTDVQVPGNVYHNPGVPIPMPDAVRKEVPGVEDVIGFHQFNGDGNVTIRKKDNEKPLIIKNQSALVLVDKSYFKLVPYQWLAGSMQTALEEPLRVVLTADRAKTYFPSIPYTDMIGKQVTYDDSIVTTVSGIVKELSHNTDFIFKEFISQATIPATGWKGNYGWNNWGNINGSSQLIIKLSPNVSPKNIQSQIQSFEAKYNKIDKNSLRTYQLQPFDDIHFNPIYSTFGDHTAHKPTLYGLLIVAAFLLLLACINFINLTTAQSSQRAKEIGVRKTLGSSATQLIFQFLTETFLLTIISLFISILITPILLKVFADFIPADLHFDLLHQPYLISFGLLLTFVVALLAGTYPALVLSRFKPVSVIKNQSNSSNTSGRKALLRKGLTLSQFMIAQIFTMATLIAVKQIHFMINKDMGFKKDAIINVYTPFLWNRTGKQDTRRMLLLNEIKQIPGVQLVSLAGGPPAENGWSSDEFKYNDGKKELVTEVNMKNGDSNYLKLYQIKILAGRNIRASDTTNEYVINETYMHILGFQKPDDVLNKRVNNMPIIGVMSDFNQESLHSPIKPMVYSSEMGNSWELHIALKQNDAEGNSWKATIAAIGKAYKKIFPESDFSYEFLDESIAKFYQAEQHVSGLLKWAAGLAIFISCMGLLGLVMFTTNQRTKEIGVRKVLGASVGQIVSILSKDFLRLVFIASVVATPLAWWAMKKWLDDFAFKTTVNWWVFVVSIAGMILIALFTLSIQTIRAASANPVESLRAE